MKEYAWIIPTIVPTVAVLIALYRNSILNKAAQENSDTKINDLDKRVRDVEKHIDQNKYLTEARVDDKIKEAIKSLTNKFCLKIDSLKDEIQGAEKKSKPIRTLYAKFFKNFLEKNGEDELAKQFDDVITELEKI